jgi:uncharacterized BrkB/YihY/UPF0761 family membrane protein
MPARTIGRRIVDVLINAFGLVAAGSGFYFGFLTIQSIITAVSIAYHARSQPAGLGGPAVGIVGMFDIIFVFVFGFATVVCLSIAGWILEPVSRWRRRRAQQTAQTQGRG